MVGQRPGKLAECPRRRTPPLTVPADAWAGDLALEPCEDKTRTSRYKAERDFLIVPENRPDSGSRLIALPMKRIHAESASPLEPIFYLAGGPGISNMTAKPPRSSHGGTERTERGVLCTCVWAR